MHTMHSIHNQVYYYLALLDSHEKNHCNNLDLAFKTHRGG